MTTNIKMDEADKSDIVKLAELLRPPEEEPEPEDHLPNAGYDLQNRPKRPTSPRSFEELEAQFEAENTIFNTRRRPAYDIMYRQAVTAEDVFLQMGPKTPSSASCEDMVVEVHLAGETYSAVDLKVSPGNVKVIGFQYELDLDLPHKVNVAKSKAEWDGGKEILVLTLRMVREFDFVNF